MKSDKPISEFLKFEFRFYKARCNMLQIDQFYILKILFDDNQYISTLQRGKNPKFNLDQTITKEFKFNDMENKFLEIILYCLPLSFDYCKEGSLENIIKKAKVYSSLKIDILTLAVGPEYHNIVLTSPKKKERVGRIMYTITCKHIANINVKINSVKIQMNELLQNNIALSLKYKEKNKHKPNSMYTNEITPNLNQKEKKTEYVYMPSGNQNNPLILNLKSSMIDFTSNDSYLNVYSVRLINKNSDDNNDYNKGYIFEHNPELKNHTDLTNNLINHYTKIGFSLLSFLEILSENDEALNKQASQFFRHMSGFNKSSEIKTSHDNINSDIKTFTIQIFQDISRNYLTTLYFDGNEIGSCEIGIVINNVPLIRQIMCGVLTENGFEINSIHLYDNILSGKSENTLPDAVTKLINTKRNLDNELLKTKDIQSKLNQDTSPIFNYLNEIKNLLKETVELVYLWYGYSSKKDLLTGQNVMLDIGISLLNIIDKVSKNNRSIIFDILKLINERGEFDLGTLSSDWFTEKSNNLETNKIYIFKFDILIKDKIIENFFEFNYKCLKYSLEKLSKGKIIEPEIKDFCIYFINIAYFRIPFFRNKLLQLISMDVKEKFEERINRNIKDQRKMISHENRNIEDLLETDPINNLLLWEALFYDKLKTSLEENNQNQKIENDIGDKFKKLKNLVDNNKDQEESWEKVFSQRGNIFFGLIEKLVIYVNTKTESSNDVNWLNIPGFIILLNAITHEIGIRPVNSYPKIFKDLFKLFINTPEIPNTFIKEIIYKTNAYDVNGIFNVFDIISSLFQEYHNRYPDRLFEKFNYNLLNQVIKHILKIDHSLCVSKVILFYYNYAHLIPTVHLGDICQNIFGKRFYDLFFHWSFEVRDKFFYLILFIMGFKLKNLIPFQDLEDLKITKNNSNEYIGINFNKSFGDILENKLKLINELQKIVKAENKDIDFNNKIDEIKYKNLLKNIPIDVHKNIVVSLHHYNKIYKEVDEFQRENRNRQNAEYPLLILIPPKDDLIEYEK